MYKVNEIFYSLQGEGRNTGRPAVFIRFSGCNLQCSFCDTDFLRYEPLTAEEIVHRALASLPASLAARLQQDVPASPAPMVVLTGGEPTLQADNALIDQLHAAGFRAVAMESNGTKEPPTRLDWLTVSPKEKVTVRYCNELKVVFDAKSDPMRWDAIQADFRYLQPCDTGDASRNRQITEACINYIKDHPQWRLSFQTHKLLNIR